MVLILLMELRPCDQSFPTGMHYGIFVQLRISGLNVAVGNIKSCCLSDSLGSKCVETRLTLPPPLYLHPWNRKLLRKSEMEVGEKR